MSRRARIQPYVTAELRKRLKGYAAAQNVTETSVAEAALKAYLEPPRDDDELILRRIDKLEDASAAVRDDLKVLGHAVAQQARVTFLAVAGAAPRAEELFAQFLAGVARDVGSGVTLTEKVHRTRLAPKPGVSTPDRGR